MKVRWSAVFSGYLADFLISQLVGVFRSPTFDTAPDLGQPADLLMIVLLTLSTGVGGYLAGRMAEEDRALNGLLVGVVGILFNQFLISLFGPTYIPPLFLISSAVGCLVGALGGYLSRYPVDTPRSWRR